MADDDRRLGDGLRDLARDALDAAGELFEEGRDALAEGIDRAGERFEEATGNVVSAVQDRVEDRVERLTEGETLGDRVRDRAGDVREAVGDAIDPLRDVGRGVVNAAGAVVGAATLGTVDLSATEGQGLDLSVGAFGREAGISVDLDGSDGDLGVGTRLDTRLVETSTDVGVDVSGEGGGITAQTGGRLGEREGSVGVSLSGAGAEGQRGFDLGAFAELVDEDGTTNRQEVGITVNRDASAGQVGLDVGAFREVSVDGERTERQEVAATFNLDASASQVGLDRGFATETFVGDEEAARNEAVNTFNVGTTGSQVEGDIGFAVERIEDGEQTFRAEAGVDVNFAFDGTTVENGSGVFAEVEIGDQEAVRAQFDIADARVGVDDDRIVAGQGRGAEVFVGGEEVFDARVGADLSLGFEDGQFVGSFDAVAEASVGDREILDVRASQFAITSDLTDPENIANIIKLATGAGLIPEGALPSPDVIASVLGGEPGALAGLLGGDSELGGRLADALGVDPSLIDTIADLASGGAENGPGIPGQEGNDVARSVISDFLDELDDDAGGGIFGAVQSRVQEAISGIVSDTDSPLVNLVRDRVTSAVSDLGSDDAEGGSPVLDFVRDRVQEAVGGLAEADPEGGSPLLNLVRDQIGQAAAGISEDNDFLDQARQTIRDIAAGEGDTTPIAELLQNRVTEAVSGLTDGGDSPLVNLVRDRVTGALDLNDNSDSPLLDLVRDRVGSAVGEITEGESSPLLNLVRDRVESAFAGEDGDVVDNARSVLQNLIAGSAEGEGSTILDSLRTRVQEAASGLVEGEDGESPVLNLVRERVQEAAAGFVGEEGDSASPLVDLVRDRVQQATASVTEGEGDAPSPLIDFVRARLDDTFRDNVATETGEATEGDLLGSLIDQIGSASGLIANASEEPGGLVDLIGDRVRGAVSDLAQGAQGEPSIGERIASRAQEALTTVTADDEGGFGSFIADRFQAALGDEPILDRIVDRVENFVDGDAEPTAPEVIDVSSAVGSTAPDVLQELEDDDDDFGTGDVVARTPLRTPSESVGEELEVDAASPVETIEGATPVTGADLIDAVDNDTFLDLGDVDDVEEPTVDEPLPQ